MPDPNYSLKDPDLFSGISKEKYANLKERVVLRHPELFDPAPTRAELEAEYDSMDDDELAEEYDKLLDHDPILWQEETIKLKNVPDWIYNTGNTAVLSQFLEEYGEAMTYEQLHIIKEIIRVTGKKADIQNRAKDIMDNDKMLYREPEVITTEDGGVSLADIHQNEFQNTGAGCWASFFQILASSRGLDLSQNDIKNYRPEKTQQQAEQTDEETVIAYNTDHENNTLEMGDSILSFLPNTMLREVEITRYNDELRNANITEEQYKESAAQELENTIRHAITVDHSPVGILLGGHYITITEINGDKIKYKNSLHHKGNKTEPDMTYDGSLRELISDRLSQQNGLAGLRGIQVTWMSNIKLSKDGKTIFGVPSEYVEMKEDGTLTEQPEMIKGGARHPGDLPINGLGTNVYRYSGKEDTLSEQRFNSPKKNNIIKIEKAYLPKKLNTEYLKKQAEKRTLQEENRLRALDSQVLGLDRKQANSLDDFTNGNIASNGRRTEEQLSNAEQQANLILAQQLEQSRKTALDNGFANILGGVHPEITSLNILNTRRFALENISEYYLNIASSYLNEAFGMDSNGSVIMELHSVLDGFTYKKTPNSEPVNLVEDVRQRLINSGRFGDSDLNDEKVYLYAKAELLRVMTTPGTELTYTNGDHKIENIFTNASFTTLTRGERIKSINNASTPDGRRINDLLQSLDIQQTEPENIVNSLLERDAKDIEKLASVYDSIFGGTDTEINDFASRAVVYSDENETIYSNTKYCDMYDQAFADSEIQHSHKQKIAFQKAMVITALANNHSVVDTDAEELTFIPPLGDAVSGKDSLKFKRTIAHNELYANNHNFSDYEVGFCNNITLDYDIEKIQNTVSKMVADIQSNDKGYIRSSKQFRNMKEKLLDLNKLVNVTWRERPYDEPITFEDMDLFLQKSDALKGDIKKYLEYKNGQMCKDPGRRKSGDTYEQKRIKANIDNLTKLTDMTKKVEHGILMGISENARDFFKSDLDFQERTRNESVQESMDAYKLNVYKSALRTNQLEDDFYTRRMVGSRKETLSEARERINSRLDKKYTIADVTALKDGSPMYKTVNNAAFRYETAKEIFSNEKIKTRYNTSYDILTKFTVIKDIDEFDAERYRCDTLARDNKTLLENSTKNATNLPLDRIKSVEVIDHIFGFEPEYQERFKQKDESKITGEEYKIFKPIKNDFKNVYKTSDPNEVIPPLSEKDFAAIAMAAAAQKEAYDLVTSKTLLKEQLEKGEITADQYKFNYKVLNDGLPDDMSMMFSTSHYTTGICDGDGTISDQVVRSGFPCIQKGRELAADALNAYKEGNLDPLAKIIAMSLNNTIRKDMNTLNISCAPETGEMAKRLCNLMERDSDLKQRVMNVKLENGKTLDHDYEQKIDSISTWGLIVDKCSIAEKILEKAPHTLTESQQIAAKADIYISRLFSDQYDDIISNKLKKDPRVTADKEQTNHLATDKLNDPNTPDYEREYYDKLLGGVKAQIYPIMFPHQNKLLEGIGKPGAYDALKAEVVKMIKSTTLKDMNYNEYSDYLDMLSKPKFDTDMSSSLTYLKNYKKEPKVNGIYQAKNFFEYDGNHFEDGERARKIIEEKLQMQQEPQIHNPQNNAPKIGNN